MTVGRLGWGRGNTVDEGLGFRVYGLGFRGSGEYC